MDLALPPFRYIYITQSSKCILGATGSLLLQVPSTKLCTIGKHAFCLAKPRLWNSFPIQLRTESGLKVALKPGISLLM